MAGDSPWLKGKPAPNVSMTDVRRAAEEKRRGSPPGSPPPANVVHPEPRSAPDSPVPGSPAPEPLAVNLWASLPEAEGHLRLPNVIVDHLYQLLDLQERSVYEQLYRLSHGYGKPTCRVGYPRLAERAGMGRTATIQTVERLVRKGLIVKMGEKKGGRGEQGSEYWVSAPGSPVPDSPGIGSPGAAPNKKNVLKTDKKGGAHARKDYSDCPDCHGTGMWYPEGFTKGVAKCRHESLKGEGNR